MEWFSHGFTSLMTNSGQSRPNILDKTSVVYQGLQTKEPALLFFNIVFSTIVAELYLKSGTLYYYSVPVKIFLHLQMYYPQ